jgi:methionyl-tRNA synthetase
MSGTFYITTPIYYVNAEPHLGHAYSTIVADVATRFHRLLGVPSRMQTGTDEHGDKIAQAAAAEGIEPKAYTDRISGMFRNTWPSLNIAPDNFIRTTDPEHIKSVQAILQKVYDAGDIYFAKYGGHYCVGCERFLTEHEMVDGKCPDHGTEPVYQEEENYFFKMTSYTDALKEYIQANPDFIRPERYKNEVLAILDQGLEDLCISRPKSRLTWGIEMPFDQNFVTYVWFDALINYITGLDWPDGELFKKFWTGDDASPQHLIAKDILKPHGIYWPTMLMALAKAEGREQDYYLYDHLNVHGYWQVGEGKMSKSRGNVVKPLDLAEVYGVDAFRYFLMREMTFGLDSAFSEDLLVERYNADLANDIGNLFSRVMNMLHRYRDGVVPEAYPEAEKNWQANGEGQEAEPHKGQVFSTAAHTQLRSFETAAAYRQAMEGFAFHQSLAWVWDLIDAANKFVVRREPWSLAKDQDKARELDHVLYLLCQRLADIAVLIWPFMPATAQTMATALNLGEIAEGMVQRILNSENLLAAGSQTAKPEALFPRVETDKVQAKAAKKEAKTDKPPAAKQSKKKDKPAKKGPAGPAEEITIDEFARVDLKMGKVLQAERIEGADKLLKLSIDLGEAEPRQVVAGIAEHYAPEEMAGRQVVVVANLKPVKLRGVESRGMVLACVDKGAVRVVAPDQDLTPGAKVR